MQKKSTSNSLINRRSAKKSQHIDKLSTKEAISLMIEKQGLAFSAVKDVISEIEKATNAAYLKLSESDKGRLVYAGAGTSARIGVQDGVELPPTFNWPRERILFLVAGGEGAIVQAVENAEDDVNDGAGMVKRFRLNTKDIIIALSASGLTPFTVGALAAARESGALTIGIANNRDTPLLKIANHPILLNTGGEIVAGSTRLTAGTAQKICLNTISTMIMVKMGYVANGMMVSMVPTNEKLRQRKKEIDRVMRKNNK